jgi:methylphosphotriester-DNA--protein-cysteine methyltransferase
MLLESKHTKSVAEQQFQVGADMKIFCSVPVLEGQRRSRLLDDGIDLRSKESWEFLDRKASANVDAFGKAEEAQSISERLQALESSLDQLFPRRAQNNVDWRARKLKEAIDNASGEVLESLGNVCSQLQPSLSGRHARRLFKQAAGISMKDYARKRRLIFAAKQLQNTEEAIKVIAADAGYCTNHGFTKAFHALFRLSPVEFRKFLRCQVAF